MHLGPQFGDDDYYYFDEDGENPELKPFTKISFNTLYEYLLHLELWAHVLEKRALRRTPQQKDLSHYKKSVLFESKRDR